MPLSDKLKYCKEELKLLSFGSNQQINNSVFRKEPTLSGVTYNDIKQTLSKI